MKRYWNLIVLFSAFSVLIWGLVYSRPSMSGLEFAQMIPYKIGDWQGEDLPVNYDALKLLGTEDVLYRKYDRLGKDRIYFLMVFSGGGLRVVHPPEVCYLGSGFEVISKEPKVIQESNRIYQGIRLVVNKDFKKNIIYYWYKTGNIYTGSYWVQQMNMAINRLLHRKTISSLIEVSIGVDHDFGSTESILDEFSKALIPVIDRYLP